jgi:magnesium chelatase accessory protein
MGNRLVWETDGRDWPHREASSFVSAGGVRWHVQQFPAADQHAPALVLLHGTGASTHSWRGLVPLLRQQFRVIAMDLPGHGFTDMPAAGPASPQFSLPGMARAVHALLQELGVQPTVLVGHSAGAALAVRMCLDGLACPRHVISLNGAFLPLEGLVGQLFSPAAKLLAAVPFVPGFFARRASDPAVLQRLVDGTGSMLDAAGIGLYGKLVASPGHVAGALAMMANWDLPTLQRELPTLNLPLFQVVGSQDRTIPPAQAHQVASQLALPARCGVKVLPGLGHLAHEERPDQVFAAVVETVQIR